MEFTLLGAALIAAIAAWLMLRFEAPRSNAADCTRQVWDALVVAAVVGMLTGRIVAMVAAGSNPLTSPGDLLIIRGGVDTVGAAIAGLLAFGWATRSDLWHLADAAAAAATAALAGWHAGCLVRDTCLGTPSDLPWAVAQAGSTVTRHPVEIYTALVLAGTVVAILLYRRRGHARAGVAAAGAVTAAALSRLVTEPLRPGLGSDLGAAYAVFAIVGILAVGWRRRNSSDRRHAAPPEAPGTHG